MWTWNRERDYYWGNGMFDTKEEAVQEAKNSGYTDFYIGECETIPLRVDVDPDRILEELDENYHDDSDCDEYIYEDVSDEDRKWLADRLSDLMYEFHERAKIEPRWFKVTLEEHIIV